MAANAELGLNVALAVGCILIPMPHTADHWDQGLLSISQCLETGDYILRMEWIAIAIVG